MKTQSSLEVPKQIRSASFDEIQAKKLQGGSQSLDPASLLKVPIPFPGVRSKSVDSGGSEEPSSFLEVPVRRFQRRRSSSGRGTNCIHCVCLEEYIKIQSAMPPLESTNFRSFSISESSSSEQDDESDELKITPPPQFLLPPIQSPPPFPNSPTIECFPAEDDDDHEPIFVNPVRRKSIQRQEAFFAEPTGTSLENMSDMPSEPVSDGTSEGALSEGDAVTIPGIVVRDIYLQVPDIKRDRAASVDSCFSKVSQVKTEELQHSGVSLEIPVGSNVALRSRSVDIVLPTIDQARYKALSMAAPPTTAKTDSCG